MTKPFTPDCTPEELSDAQTAVTSLASLLNCDPVAASLLAKAKGGEISEAELMAGLLSHLEAQKPV